MEKKEIVFSACSESEAVITLEQKGKGMNELKEWVVVEVSEKAECVLDEMLGIIEQKSDLSVEKAEDIETIDGDKKASRQVDLDNREVIL